MKILSLRFQSPLPQLEVVQSHHDERMKNLSAGDKIWNICDRDQPSDQIFTLIELDRVDAAAILDQDCETHVAHDRRVREYLADEPRVFPFVAGFLAQFAQGGFLG